MRENINRQATREGWVIIGSLFGSLSIVTAATATIMHMVGA